MKNQLISIIVPIYNVEKYLDRCMESLLNQTYTNIEIIMVDDESPDNCPQMCDDYKQRDSRIKVIHKKNGGLGFARNSGLDIAEGEYIVFVDSDDYVTLDMCEKLYNKAKQYDADIVYGGIFYDSGKKKMASHVVEKEILWQGSENVKSLLLDFIGTKPSEKRDTIMEVSVWKALFKKSIFDEFTIKFVSERQYISEDIIFDIDYISKCKCVVAIPDPIYYYCVNPNSLSKSFRTDRFIKVKILYNEMIRKLNEIYLPEEYRERTDRFLIARARTNIKAINKHKNVIEEKEKKDAIFRICDDVELNAIFDRYPINKLPFKYRVIAKCIKKRRIKIMEILLK